MPTTLLAVDDSATMRKVLEMTFAGEDYKVVTANSADAALSLAKTERPAIVVSDITLEGKSGYEFCSAFKKDFPTTPVLLLSSKLHPYDPAKGQACRADDHIDKPFDTQQLIDRVRTMLTSPRPAVGAAPQQAAKPTVPGAPYRAPAMGQTPATPAVAQRPAAPAVAPRTTPSAPFVAPVVAVRKPTPAPAAAANLRSTQEYSTRSIASSIQQRTPAPAVVTPVPAHAPPPVAHRPTPSSGTTAVSPISPAIAAVVAASASTSSALPADMSKKLADLGLTKDQVEAVLAMSRDIVERVVWEVVPVLAETMIKEEIKRLTAD